MSKNGRKTIGNDMIDQLDGNPFELLTTPIAKFETQSKKINGSAVKTPLVNPVIQSGNQRNVEKERITVQINKKTIEKVKDCVYWNRATVAQFVEEALEAAIELAEKENGKPFEKRKSELKPGRPMK